MFDCIRTNASPQKPLDEANLAINDSEAKAKQIPFADQDLDAVANYFNDWGMYQQVIRYNYMEHAEVQQIIHRCLKHRYESSFSMLDLGCGDASFSANLLTNLPIHAYTGVDIAKNALELAHSSLQVLNCPVTLVQQDLLKFLASHGAKFDVILSAFSIHHLSSEQKQLFLYHAKQRLNPGGILLFLDVFRKEEESRARYLQRYSENIRKYWVDLIPEYQKLLIEHIVDSDRPECESSVREWCKVAGFRIVELLYQGGRDTQKLLIVS